MPLMIDDAISLALFLVNILTFMDLGHINVEFLQDSMFLTS